MSLVPYPCPNNAYNQVWLNATARRVADGNSALVEVTSDNLHDFLGVAKIEPDAMLRNDEVGVATGLAVTATGGDILFIEAITMKGKGLLQLTGQLGDVMRESAQAAFSYARSRARELGIDEEIFNRIDIHIHIPEGAIPKDGPSAGITMATALVSALSNRPVRKNIAMTGEITLRGEVLPIGGVKEKVLAAYRAQIKKVILPHQNRKDMEDVPQEPQREMEFVFVDNVQQVFQEALLPALVAPEPVPVPTPELKPTPEATPGPTAESGSESEITTPATTETPLKKRGRTGKA